MTCRGPECSKPVFRTDLCFGHYKQIQRGERLSKLEPRGQTPWQRLSSAAIDYADAGDSPEEYARAKARLVRAAKAYRPMGIAPRPRRVCRQQLELFAKKTA